MMTMITMVIPILIDDDDDYSQNYNDDEWKDDGNDTVTVMINVGGHAGNDDDCTCTC